MDEILNVFSVEAREQLAQARQCAAVHRVLRRGWDIGQPMDRRVTGHFVQVDREGAQAQR